MKFKKTLKPVIILILIIAAFAALYFAADKFNFTIPNPFVKKENLTSSSAVLKQIEDLSRLNYIEFIYKTVFLFNLIDPGADFKKLVEEYRAGKKLSFKEIELLSVYGISAEAGIDLLNDKYSFAVITARIKAGYNFPDRLPADSVSVDENDNSIHVILPPVQITEIIIEDADSSVYNYPDLKVSPEQWKTLTSLISKLVESEAESRGILEKADLRGKETIRQLLLSAGFSQVSFAQ